ncbi:MAG: hypothetical protein WA908_04790 [Pontixanthobacter sp.]
MPDFAAVFDAASDEVDGKTLPDLPDTADVPAQEKGAELDTMKELTGGPVGKTGEVEGDTFADVTSITNLERYIPTPTAHDPMPEQRVALTPNQMVPSQIAPTMSVAQSSSPHPSQPVPQAPKFRALPHVQSPQPHQVDARLADEIPGDPVLTSQTELPPSRGERVPLRDIATLQIIASTMREALARGAERADLSPTARTPVMLTPLVDTPFNALQPSPLPGNVTAPSPSTSQPSDQPRDFAALMDRLVQAREATNSSSAGTAKIALPHAEFGGVTMRFDTSGGNLAVGVSSNDPSFSPTIRAALADTATGDPSQRGGQNGGMASDTHHSTQREPGAGEQERSHGGDQRANRNVPFSGEANDNDPGIVAEAETPNTDGLYV